MLHKLRSATEQLHRDLEKDNLANKIMDHSINLNEYKLLLTQNYLAYAIVEPFLERYLEYYRADKSDRLKTDLLSMDSPIPKVELWLDFSCNNLTEAIGAAYVVEGSAMGGLMIGKNIPDCNSLENIPPQKFYSGKREDIQGFQNFQKLLRSKEFSEEEKDMAAKKAVETFELFGKAYCLQLQQL
ncbi:biliverdin-producing heme oxygenase [Christiangramia antarctica]|nr:heme oxygenase [Gramella sp. AN32]